MRINLTNPSIRKFLEFTAIEPSRFREPLLRKLQRAVESQEDYIELSEADVNQMMNETGKTLERLEYKLLD